MIFDADRKHGNVSQTFLVLGNFIFEVIEILLMWV